MQCPLLRDSFFLHAPMFRIAVFGLFFAYFLASLSATLSGERGVDGQSSVAVNYEANPSLERFELIVQLT